MKLRVKNILVKLLYLLSLPMIIGGFVFAHEESKCEKINDFRIDITNPQYSFIVEKDILSYIDNHRIKKNETYVKDINLTALENECNNKEWIHSSEWYVDASNNLNIRLKQSEPVVRIQSNDSADYGMYLDSYANEMALSRTYSAAVPIVTTANSLGYNQTDMALRKQVVELATYIQSDSFWSAAIAQIHIDDNNEFELIPALGTQVIKFGTTEMKEDKLARLMAFYKKSTSELPWEKYQELDVRFKNQIICRNLRGEILSKDPYDEDSKKILKEQEAARKGKMPASLKNEKSKQIQKISDIKKVEKNNIKSNQNKKPSQQKP